MTFEEKVKLLRSQPQFMVAPISEVRAIAFAAREKKQHKRGDIVLASTTNGFLSLTQDDTEKILNVYPDLRSKLASK
jgi:hypothetical protein